MRSRNRGCHGKAIHVSLCLCSCLSYLACKSHLFCVVLNYNLWPLRRYHILSHFLIKDMIFEKKNIKHKTPFDFLHEFCLKCSSRNNSAKYHNKCT